MCRCNFQPQGLIQMGGGGSNDTGSTTPVSITVLSVTPMRAGKLFAIAAVEIDIDGVPIEIHGIRALHVPPAATRIELPTFRDTAGRSGCGHLAGRGAWADR